jgi:hypothetical protein
MAAHLIAVDQDGGEIVVTFPGVARTVLPVVDGHVTIDDDDVAAEVLRVVPAARAADPPAGHGAGAGDQTRTSKAAAAANDPQQQAEPRPRTR